MNTDIRLSIGFWQHPKTYRLIKRIGLKGVRSLQILWCWCAQNRPDGSLFDLDASEIEFAADWRGKKGAFAEACASCGWLDATDEGFALHEWADYNPYQAQAGSREAARKERARNAANARWDKERHNGANGRLDHTASNAQAYAKTDSSICSDDAASNAQAMPSLTSTSIKNIKESSLRSDSFCAEASGDASAQDGNGLKNPSQIFPPVITLPLNTGIDYPVTREMIDKWQELYPAVDVLQQVRSMRGWLDANPVRRKTKNGIHRFINRWLADKQDQGGRLQPRASPAAVYTQSGEMSLAQRNYQTAMSVIADLEREKMERAS